ncbi:MAG: GntR family transcriptional regulator [Oscillospiraceae bacterium]
MEPIGNGKVILLIESTYDLGNTMLLKDRVYQALKNDIILGKFKAGEQLNMLELCGRMNISSAPLREALSMLGQSQSPQAGDGCGGFF